MENNKYEYCCNICNYLNNLKGYIEEYEVKNLLFCVFGLSTKCLENEITYDDVLKLSCDVECDKGNDFYEDLYCIYKRIIIKNLEGEC